MSDVASVSGSSDSGRAWEAEVGKPVVVKLEGLACKSVKVEEREPLPVGERESETSCYTRGDLLSIREVEKDGALIFSQYQVRVGIHSLFLPKESIFPSQSPEAK